MRPACMMFLVWASSAPNGSSMRRTSGLLTRARAMPTRCFIPPESSLMRASLNFSRPTTSRYFSALSRRSSLGTPAISRPSSTFLITDLHGSRAKSWKTMPLSGPGEEHGRPSIVMEPDVGSRRPAIILRMVVLPHPDGPMMEISSPFLMSRVKSSMATVSFSSLL